MDILVAYATAHGSTRSIAERMAAALRDEGFTAEARPFAEVEDVHAWQAFVLGSAVHSQRWLAPAEDFLSVHQELLATRPVWLYSVGMPAALRGPWRRLAAKEEAVIERNLPPTLRYRGHRLFSGVIERSHLPRAGRLFFVLLGGRFGDFRDWAAVRGWTAGIAENLRRGG
ncbi:flavodoxin domain-containing protein [Streptomyces sp. NPDC023723]|uniref:flavodoxin domain-containing protein n=1 Tax=Streptomyces sp. NPDC023723 TaxID=3154323 RepID=UPI0033BFDD4E